jgi:hypothetical protein
MEDIGAKQQSEALKVKHERREHKKETNHERIGQDGVQNTLQSAPSRQNIENSPNQQLDTKKSQGSGFLRLGPPPAPSPKFMMFMKQTPSTTKVANQ